MVVEMELQVKFNRNIDLDKDYITPGGYEMVMNGRTVEFDFCNSYSAVHMDDSTIGIFHLENMDVFSFPELKKIRLKDLKNVTSINECYVYTGEDGESDLEVVSVEKITFFAPYSRENVIDVPDDVIEEYNEKILSENNKDAEMYEIKILPGNEATMFKQLAFYSRFLDVPIDELCEYSTPELRNRIESTLMQMPEEELENFEKEFMEKLRAAV